MSIRRLAPLAAVAISGTAVAGIVGTPAQITSMQVGRGSIDIQNPFGSGVNTATIANPTVGSILLLGGSIPNVERYLSVLEFASISETGEGIRSRFDFQNEIEVDPFASPEFEYAFAGNRLQFTTETATSFTVAGSVSLSGGGALFVYDYSDPQSLFIMDVPLDVFAYSFSLEAGSHTIAWGVLAEPEGGLAEWEGAASVLVIPAPGAVALLSIAGFVLGRRRRR